MSEPVVLETLSAHAEAILQRGLVRMTIRAHRGVVFVFELTPSKSVQLGHEHIVAVSQIKASLHEIARAAEHAGACLRGEHITPEQSNRKEP